jgi:hypothetical protein
MKPLILIAVKESNPCLYRVLTRIFHEEVHYLNSLHKVSIELNEHSDSKIQLTIYGSRDGQGGVLQRVCELSKEMKLRSEDLVIEDAVSPIDLLESDFPNKYIIFTCFLMLL